MSERFWRWATPMFHVAGVLAWAYIAMSILMRVFPPSETAVLAISAFVVFWLFVGGVVYLLVHLSIPDGWADRGIWRFTLFSFGFIFMARSRHEKKIESIQKAGYTVWRPGKRWAVAPSVPGWCMRMARHWRAES